MAAPDYEIIATAKVALHHAQDAELEHRLAKHSDDINRIWSAAQEQSSALLFNGSLLIYSSHKVTDQAVTVTGHFAEYKQYIAHREQPGLGLNLFPIGVSGLVTGEDKSEKFVVFARRARNMSTYGGRLELLPSGAIDRACALSDGTVDFCAKLLEEFSEEAAPPSPGTIRGIESFAFVLDRKESVYDVCCHLDTALELSFFIEGVAASKEYENAICVPFETLAEYVGANRADLIPTSHAVAQAFLNR